MDDMIHALLFDVRRSVRYHVRRRMFFDRINLAASAASVIFGSAAMAAMLGGLGQEWVMAAAGMVTILSAINLVVGSSRMARLHADLARKFIELEKQIISAGDAAVGSILVFKTARLDIEAEEPPVLRVLDTLCHNELMCAMGYPASQQVNVSWYQRLFAQLVDISDHRLVPAP